MEIGRWIRLMEDEQLELTEEELEAGYHWCSAWDGLLVGPDMPEWGEDSLRCRCGRRL